MDFDFETYMNELGFDFDFDFETYINELDFETYKIMMVLLVAVVLIGIIFKFTTVPRKNARLRRSISSGKFIYYKDFEENWIIEKSGKKGTAGYKYNDRPGCYVITVYDDYVTGNNYSKYENIYIGQSVNICQRVHNHFTGKGKGDIYADIKYGKHVYVRLVPCGKKEMNNMEKQLIKAFNATKSYNATKGGGKRR
ncbi:MAG: GIY-YIG nuclease family protein [Acutalibacteraceae bacterium]|nr:GIY-YIG nuclease family protein [Acutalibacteraceae bacterium]